MEGHTWYFDASGKRKNGLVKTGGKEYYFDPTTNEMVKNTTLTLNGVDYVFGPDGARIVEGWAERNGKKVYIQKDGSIANNGWLEIAGFTYYFNSDGSHKADELADIDGKTYGFDAEGRRCMGDGPVQGIQYRFNQDGTMVPGFHDAGKRIYVTLSNKLVRANGHEKDRDYEVWTDGNGAVTSVVCVDYPYFNQKQHNATGQGEYICGPTSTAMALSFLTRDAHGGTNADLVYDMVNKFSSWGLFTNSLGTTSSDAYVRAGQEAGFNATGVGYDVNRARDYLLKGGAFVIVTNKTPWVASTSIAHAMSMSGYKDGQTYISDPYSPHLSGWYDLADVMQNKLYAGDGNGGSTGDRQCVAIYR